MQTNRIILFTVKQHLHIFPIMLLLALIIFTMEVHGQVTIGSGKPPVLGALLDLKEYDFDDIDTENRTTASRGVNLPRVRLVDKDKLLPMFDNMKDITTYNKNGINYSKADEDSKHIGLIVYNLTDDPVKEFSEGIYYWNGAFWQRNIGLWNKVGSDKPAVENADDSYLQGKVVVGGKSIINDAFLSVHGTVNISGDAIVASNPSAILDIQSANKGVLIPKIGLSGIDDKTTVEAPAKGLMVYNTNKSMVKGEGLYINYGNEKIPEWVGFVNNFSDKSNQYQFSGFEYIMADEPVRKEVAQNKRVNDLELGMELSVTVPPMSENQIMINYSIPAGQYERSEDDPSAYIGIRFMKKIGDAPYEESPKGSRKYAVAKVRGIYYMVTIASTTVEMVTNKTNAPLVVKYKLYGYIETGNGKNLHVIYNRWSNDDTKDNYNWGIATMISQVYTKAWKNK